MVFSSVLFLFFFLPLVLSGYLLAGNRWRNTVLLVSSLIFYAWGEGIYVLVLIGCIVANYYFGKWIQRARDAQDVQGARFLTVTAIVVNIGILLAFKYTNFLVATVNSITLRAGLGTLPQTNIPLPIGISFFTFQALSYVIDVHRGDVQATKSMFRFAVYKSLFPQLIAGPIIRYRDVASQMAVRVLSAEGFAEGARRFVIGLGKKVLIANTVAVAADEIFALSADNISTGVAWLGIICYSLQIYFDFSGYSDMAIGMGKMFGFTFLENFNYPYISRSIREFWRRWHISLSTWFRDYLYIPLGGSRRSEKRTYLNLLVVFLLCGFWHGANWTFVVWGLWHGAFLVIERLPLVDRYLERAWKPVQHAYALLVIMTGWVFFRTNSIPSAIAYLGAMFGFDSIGGASVAQYLDAQLVIAVLLGAAGAAPVIPKVLHELEQHLAAVSGGISSPFRGTYASLKLAFLGMVFLFSSMSLFSGTHNPFIYFRF